MAASARGGRDGRVGYPAVAAISHVLTLDDSAARCGRRPCRDVVGCGSPRIRKESRAEKPVSTPGAGRVGDRGTGRPGSPYRMDGATIDSRYGGSAIAPAAGPMTRPGAGVPRPGGRPANDGLPAGRGQVRASGQLPGAGYSRGGGQPPGGFGDGAQADAEAQQLVAWLRTHQPGSTYLLAVQGSSQAGQ